MSDMQERLGPRWYPIGKGQWQHEESGRIVEPDAHPDWVDSDPPLDEDMLEYCEHCGYALEWEDCDMCGGDGFYDAYEEDPLWFDPGDTERCPECDGKGGWSICVNKNCKVTP